MSVYARKRRMTDRCTYWTLTSESEYGSVWSTPKTLACNFRQDSSIRRDDQGAEFSPSTTFRFFGDPSIKKGDRIVRGVALATEPTSGAETVRKVETKTAMRGSAAYDIFTG